MRFIDKTLSTIRHCIQNNAYEEVETDKFELKDLSGGSDWTEFYKSVCAFLNTNGGMVVVGIKDKGNIKDKSQRFYKCTGFNYDDEAKLKKDLYEKFTDVDGRKLDLSAYFPAPEIVDFLEQKVAIIYVEKLPEEVKFAHFKGVAYKRLLTGDTEITQTDIQIHQEQKEELLTAQELQIVDNAELKLLNIDKLNQYIIKLNTGRTVETLKANLKAATSFLVRKGMIRDNKPTLLGMLVCGDYVEDYLGGRGEVDCYVQSPMAVAQNKQILKNNIIDLMESSIAFVFQNIQVGVSYINGGSAAPEYPEELIRENINNALAHRDYKSSRFVIVEIRPDNLIEIQNPGSFRARQRIYIDTGEAKVRRIVPIQVARNPKLLDVLKSYDRWEGKGRGLASLTTAALHNQIDVAYYNLSAEEIKLHIPKGKVYDSEMELWLNSFAGYLYSKNNNRELSESEKIVLSYLYKSERLNRLERYTVMLTADNNHIGVIADLESKGLIFKHSDSPDIYPIYLVDRVLSQTDFSESLRVIFGTRYDQLPVLHQEVLAVIYQHNKFSNTDVVVSANNMGNYIYTKTNKGETDLRKFDSFKRKIFTIFKQLEGRGFIERKAPKRNFAINYNFKPELSLL